MYVFEDYIAKTLKAQSTDELSHAYSKAIEAEGYENCILTSIRNQEVRHVAWFEFPDGYVDAYFENRWEKIDPILDCSLRAPRPFFWNQVVQERKLSSAQHTFMNECRELGVHSGIVFPMHGPGERLEIMSISRRADDSSDPGRLGVLHAMSVQTWSRYLELSETATFVQDEDIRLTPRELEILRWCKDGKTYSEISEILSISSKTVEFHMGNLMDKLRASNKISAIVIAIQRGVLDL